MAVKRGLGKGFDDLIPTDVIAEEFDVTSLTDDKVSDLREIKIEEIIRDEDQPRKDFEKEALNDLANSIREHGVLQPIIVTKKGNKFQIIAGERRWRASQIAGIKTIPSLIRSLSGQQKLEQSLIENLQREDLKPLEMATALNKMYGQFNMTLDEMSKRIGKSRSVITNHIRLLRLPEFARKAMAEGKVTEGHGRQILALDGDIEAQKTLTNAIVKNDWSVRKAEQFVVAYKRGEQGEIKNAKNSIKGETPFTRKLTKRIGLQVKQKTTTGQGGGQIIISYKNDEELAKLEELL